MKLTVLGSPPAGLLDMQARDLHSILTGPTLIHLPGRRPEPLFVSVLLHGNEDTGLKAVQAVLQKYLDRELPRAFSLFIGNIAAARAGVRRLENQVDYNRVWPGADGTVHPEHAIMARVVEEMKVRKVFASIDIHNNTGLNPHYACINRLDPHFFHLARLFSRIVVHFVRPPGVQSAAFADICPAVTVECGKAGVGAADDHAERLVEAALHLDHFPEQPLCRQEFDLYHTVATVKVPESIDFLFGQGEADIVFEAELDHFNFCELQPGTCFGRVDSACRAPLEVWDEEGLEVAARFFELSDGWLLTRRAFIPAMITRDERVIRQDCLCYLMERLPYPGIGTQS
ncbi:MAG: M14 family metallopeptidase [Nitrosospira sp.]|nr:M14 family metallopeptidase [Nitrosospira sp.]